MTPEPVETLRPRLGQPTGERTGPAEGHAGRTVVQAWLASRALIATVALLLAVYQGRSLTDMVSNWDVQHFTRLARGGYLAEPGGVLMAFFPGFPSLLRLFLAVGVPVAVTGVLLSTVCSAVAAAALVRLGGPWAAVWWLFAPTAVFTVVPYTESLFCAAAFWAWERARADRWWAAAVLAGVSCTVRVSGVFLVGALIVLILTTHGVGWWARVRRAGWLFIPVLALTLYVIFLHRLTGSWTAWYAAQAAGWAREMTWPWQSFLHTVAAAQVEMWPDRPLVAAVFTAELVAMALGLLVAVWCVARRCWAEASWVAVQVLAFSVSYWFFSVNRAILLWFPLWIMLGRWSSWRPASTALRVGHRVLVIATFSASVLVMLGWSWLFFTGQWAS